MDINSRHSLVLSQMSQALDRIVFDALLQHPHVASNRVSEANLADALWLHTDLGPTYFLTRDGTVLISDAFEELPPRQATPGERCAALVLGAKNLDCSDLLALLPPMPSDSVLCPKCNGKRWARVHPAADFEIICLECSGKGWS